MAKLKVLKSHPLCKELSDKELAYLAQLVDEKIYPSQTPIFVENMLGEDFFIVKRGRVRVSFRRRDGQDEALDMLGPGDCFGCLGLLDAGQRTLSVYADEETEALLLSKARFDEIQAKEPAVAVKLYRFITAELAQQLREAIPLVKTLIGP